MQSGGNYYGDSLAALLPRKKARLYLWKNSGHLLKRMCLIIWMKTALHWELQIMIKQRHGYSRCSKVARPTSALTKKTTVFNWAFGHETVRLKISEKFRGLQAGSELHFLRDWDKDSADEFAPYILAGPNGCGKSNVLRVLKIIMCRLLFQLP